MCSLLYGYNDGELGDAYLKVVGEQIANAGFLHCYMDSREQTGISAEERERLARWTKDQGEKYRAGHLLFKSRLLELAVALVNLFTGGAVKTYSKVEEFEAAIRRELPGFVKLPVFDAKQVAKRSA